MSDKRDESGSGSEDSGCDPETAYSSKEQFRMWCKREAVRFLESKQAMDEDEALKYVKKTVSWQIRSASFQDEGQADKANLKAVFNFGKEPVTASLDYFVIPRYSSADYGCKFKIGDAFVLNTTNPESSPFKLKAAQLKALQDKSFPEDWPPGDVLRFIYACMCTPDPCYAAECDDGLEDATTKLCEKL